MTTDARQYAPAAARNRDPILAVLADVLAETDFVLEIASGSGEHAVHMATHRPGLIWQPSDPSPAARASIDAWREAEGIGNIRPALEIDVTADTWPVERADAIICINMIHISPWGATLGLMKGAARLIPAGGILYLYGPYRRNGAHTAPSNAEFDASLKARNPAWGVRDLEDVIAAAEGFALDRIVEMPANNLSVVLRRL